MLHNPNYRIVHFATPEELERAAAFDTLVFSENRVGIAGDEVVQPTVDVAYYENLVANGGRVFGLVQETEHQGSESKILALGAVALNEDPTADEFSLRHMVPEAAYMLVLATRKEMRGQGLAAKILRLSLDIAHQEGKRRMITTVHPSNIPSQRTFYRAGFITLGVQSNYYALDGKNGMRFILVHNDLTNEQWARENTTPVIIAPPLDDTVYIPHEASLTAADTEIDSILNATLAMGLCITDIKRSKEDPSRIRFSYARFNGDPALVPQLMYPYKTLAEAYSYTPTDTEELWQLTHQILLDTIDRLPAMNMPFPETAPTVMASETAENKRLFMDWLADYQKYLAKPAANNMDLLPHANTFIMAKDDLYDALLVFLLQQNMRLRRLTSSHSPLATWRINRKYKRVTPNLDSRRSWDAKARGQYIVQLGEQNKAIYQLVKDTPPTGRLKAALTKTK